jgi:hypothetical protein
MDQVKKWNHWQGEDSVHGNPVHPTRKIYDNPPMYEFATPFKSVTYPPFYDPSYWYEGLKLTVDLRKQFSVIVRNAERLLLFLASSPGPATNWLGYADLKGSDRTIGSLLTLFCVIVFVNLGHVTIFRGMTEHWFVLVPIGAVLGLYALLHFEGRYIAAYVVILWVVLFRSVTIPYSKESQRIFIAVLALAALTTTITLAVGTAQAIYYAAHFSNDDDETSLLQSGYTDWKVAKYLHNAGVGAGAPVGAIGWTFSAYWARMARVHVVAEVPEEGRTAFWSSDEGTNAAVMQLFRDVGAKAVVASHVPAGSAPLNWRHIEGTEYYVYVF